MKNLNKIITLAAAGIIGMTGLGLSALADDAPSSPPPDRSWSGDHSEGRHNDWNGSMRKHRMARLLRRLDLTDAQRAQLRHLHAQTMADIWSARADGNLTVDQLHERISGAVRKQHEGFRNLLTPEQRARLDRMTHHEEPPQAQS